MHLWFLSNPEAAGSLVAGREARNNVIARASVLSVLAVERAVETSVRAMVSKARALQRAIQQENDRRRAIATLRELDDRMLRDMGISRSEIMGVVESGLQRRPVSLAELRGLRRPHHGAATPAAQYDDLPKAA